MRIRRDKLGVCTFVGVSNCRLVGIIETVSGITDVKWQPRQNFVHFFDIPRSSNVRFFEVDMISSIEAILNSASDLINPNALSALK
jgi:hypothetical protein